MLLMLWWNIVIVGPFFDFTIVKMKGHKKSLNIKMGSLKIVSARVVPNLNATYCESQTF